VAEHTWAAVVVRVEEAVEVAAVVVEAAGAIIVERDRVRSPAMPGSFFVRAFVVKTSQALEMQG